MNTMKTLIRPLSLPSAVLGAVLTAGALVAVPAQAAERAAAVHTNQSCHKETKRVFVPQYGNPKGRGVPGVESRTVTVCDSPAKAERDTKRDGAPQPGTYGPRRNP